MTGPACGNNPNHHMSDGDRQAVADFKAYLAARAALRDRLAAAIWERQNPGRRWADCEYGWRADAEEDADAVLAELRRMADAVLPAVLPATTNHDTDDVAARTLVSLEKVTDRARRAEAEVKRLRTMYDASEARVNDLIEERDQLLETRTDRAAALREAADEIAGIDFHPNARARSLDIAAGLARRLRCMADETAATAMEADNATLLELVRDFLDPDPCTFDHHGYCQAHAAGFGGEPMSCPHGRAKKLLAELEQPAAGARQDETERCAHCNHPKGDHDGRADHRAKHSPLVAGEPWCHACNAQCDYAAGARQDGAQS